MRDERGPSPLSDEFVLASFCGGGVSSCGGVGVSSAHSRGLMRRWVVLMRRLGRGRFLLPPRGGGGDCEAEKTNAGVAVPTAGSVVSLAAAEDVEPMCKHAGAVEGTSANPPLLVAPVRAVFGECRDAAPPLPEGINGCFGEAKKERPLVFEPLEVGVRTASGEAAANTKPPLEVGPVGVLGRSGAAKKANMFPALLASDPPGVLGAFSAKANMFPAAGVGWIGRSPGANENSAAVEDPARGATGEGEGVGAGGGVPGAGSKGASSSSILLRTEEAGRRQRRLRPASAAQGAEKATAVCAGSMRSSARCRGAGGGVKKKGSRAMAMALQRRLRPASAAQGAEKATAVCAGSMRSSARCRGAGGGVKKKGSRAMAMAL
nr:unnamed protein product [Digitaria exilis]